MSQPARPKDKRPATRARPEEEFSLPEARFVMLWSQEAKTSATDDEAAGEGEENNQSAEDKAASPGDRKARSLVYRVRASSIAEATGTFAASIDMEVDGSFKKLKIEVKARYLLAFEERSPAPSLKEQEQIILAAARTSVWPRFRDLFALIIAQTSLPPLPQKPSKIGYTIAEVGAQDGEDSRRRRKASRA